ncbi:MULTISPECIES: hypothetical protein [Bacillaceae]|uniref:Cytosolic protein n=1 Tax=Evansella alkalicola TaxID=745819 RepID=A0ABS6JUC1_9BACI|nr:hypothetical protein [Litchfieldia alkalitelluris]MBU9722136.1 hypothetical protein [Bacillus alkalicola]
MTKKEEKHYTDFSTVEKNRNEVIPEQTPEGPYGSPYEGSLEKTTPWQEGQRSVSGFAYENRNLHQDLERKDPNAHKTHDDKRVDSEEPF